MYHFYEILYFLSQLCCFFMILYLLLTHVFFFYNLIMFELLFWWDFVQVFVLISDAFFKVYKVDVKVKLTLLRLDYNRKKTQTSSGLKLD